jgi:hypothetical protein
LSCKKKLAAEKWPETHFLINKEKVKWIKDYVDRETAGARKWVEDAEAAVRQVQDDMTDADIAGFTSWQPVKMLEEMLVANGDSVSDLASPNNGEDGADDDDEETDHKLSEEGASSWVMDSITKTIQQHIQRFRQ